MKSKKIKSLLLGVATTLVVGVGLGSHTYSDITKDSVTYESTKRAIDPSISVFPESSKPLEAALIATYPTMDNAPADGFINETEAGAWTSNIVISNRALSGTIDGIEYFTKIVSFNLTQNQFSGSIPAEIGNMTSLTSIYLNNNRLTGSIPSTIGNLTSLITFRLYTNNLTGEIPSSIGNMTSLTELQIQSNKFTGEIPSSIGNLTNLTILRMQNNNLTGSIPVEIGNLTSLTSLQLGTNKLTGEIPMEIGSMVSLEVLSVSNNQNLTGNFAQVFATSDSIRIIYALETRVSIVRPQIESLEIFAVTLFNEQAGNFTTFGEVTRETLQEVEDDLLAYFGVESLDAILTSDPTIAALVKQVQNGKKVLDVIDASEDIFNEDGTIKDGVTIEDLEEFTELVGEMPAGEIKDEYHNKITEAEKHLKPIDPITTPEPGKETGLIIALSIVCVLAVAASVIFMIFILKKTPKRDESK